MRVAAHGPLVLYFLQKIGFDISCGLFVGRQFACVRNLCSGKISKISGSSCSKLMMSLVNDSLKFTPSDTQIR